MASLSRYDKVKAVGKYAASLVYDVQRDYVSGSGSNARGRARLSRLHRDLDGASPSWMLIGDELFSNWPTELDEPADNSPEFERRATQSELRWGYMQCISVRKNRESRKSFRAIQAYV